MANLQTDVIKEEAREGTVISDGKELRNFDESYREKYQTNVLPAIKQALKDDWLNVRLEKVCFHNVTSFVQDIVVVPGAGPLIQTSSFLLASLSPWLRHLLQSAGEDVCLCLPSVSSHEVSSYLPRVYSVFQNHIFFE